MQAPENPADAAKAAGVDEDEWAAFEAEIEEVEVRNAAAATSDGIITAAPMTAAESAAAAAAAASDNDGQPPKAKADLDIDAEKEEARDALVNEMEEMANLESRVRKLKERREALRRKSNAADGTGDPSVGEDAPEARTSTAADDADDMGYEARSRMRGHVARTVSGWFGQERAGAPSAAPDESPAVAEDSDDGEEDEDDDWAAFRA